MKKIFCLFIAFTFVSFFTGSLSAQPEKHREAESRTPKAEWKESNEFHTVMAATFHPAEDGNFKPVRERSAELVTKATAWMNSTPPAEMSKPEIKENLKKLVAQATEVNTLVEKKATDAELKKQLSTLHDTFHTIIGLCRHDESAK